MSTTIDQRVVEMRFDNKHFESNVSSTMSTLDKLKQALKLTDASKGLSDLNNTAKRFDLSGIGNAADTVGLRFNALYTVADQALRNIVNSAMHYGEQIVSALTIDPIKSGFQEYETQINAVQTILANTSHEGTKLTDVNKALDELNAYADKTIYNFTEMTRNIGTFTAAGVSLDTSVSAIKGIANLAAVSGSTSQQASTAMYQLSQALASGTVKLQDWNSVVNAGMGGKVFQDALIRTAAALDGSAKNVNAWKKENIDSFGSFRDSLTKGAWLTTDVLTKTLDQFTGDMTEAELKAQGFTAQQIKDIQAMAVTANDAATKVKTVTQLWDTLKEAAQSGWTQTWEIIVGDFEEAKKLLTSVSDTLNEFVGKSAEARNKVLQGWKDMGGRTAILDALKNTFEGIISIIKPIKEAFTDIFPPITARQLVEFSRGLRDLTKNFKLSETASDNLKRTFKGLFSIIDLAKQIFVAIFKAIGPLVGGFGTLGGGILEVTASIGDWIYGISQAADKSDIFNKALQNVVKFIKLVVDAVSDLAKAFKEDIISPFLERVKERMGDVSSAADGMKSGVSIAIGAMGDALKNSDFIGVMESVWNAIKTVGEGIVDALGYLTEGLMEKLGNFDFKGLFDIFNTATLGVIGGAIAKFLHGLNEPLESLNGIFDGVVDILDGVKDTLKAYQTQLKAEALTKIATAIGILTASIVVLSLIDSEKLSESLGAVTVLFGDLMGSMALFGRISGNLTGVTKACIAMESISVAILILAGALKAIGDLDFEHMTVGLVGVIGLAGTLVATAKILGSGGKTVIKGAGQMVIFAAAIKILASACTDLSALNWNELAKGLVGVGVLLGEVSLFMNTAKFSGKSITTATGIVILAAAMKVLASACSDFAHMSWEDIGKGLASIGGLLLEISLFTNLTGNAKHVLSSSAALIAIGAAMKIFASSLKDFGSMRWDEIGRGLTALGGSLLAVTTALNFMPKNMIGIGTGLIAVSAALVILAEALNKMSSMTWEEVAKGLVTLGGALGIMAIALNAMKGTLAGSAAMAIATIALNALVPVITTLGKLSWTEIAKGLTTLAGAFTILGVAGAVLTPLVGTILALSASFALIGVAVLAIGGGLMAAGAGLSAIAVGFAALVTSITGGSAAIVASLTVIIMGIVKLIPSIIEVLGEAIISICNVIADGAPALWAAIEAIVLSTIDALVECIPAIVTGVFKLLVEVLKSLVDYTPQIVEALYNFTIGILKALTEKIPELVKVATEFIMTFFGAIIDAIKGIDVGVLVQGLAGVGLMAAIMLALANVAALVPGAMAGVLGMGLVVAELALVLAAIGALAQIPGLDWLINEGGNLLESIGTAIGKFIGGVVGGFMGGVSSQFPEIGKDLSGFMDNAKPFIEGAKRIDDSVIDGVKTMAEAIIILTGANLIEGITSWLTGGSSLADFGAEIAAFGPSLKSFADSVAGIDVTAVSAAAEAAKILAGMANTVPNEGGLAAWFAGENSLAAFGDNIVSFGHSLKEYSLAVTGIDPTAITASATAAQTLAAMANTIPNEGGVLAWFAGDNSLAKFGPQIVSFGESLKEYANAVVGIDPTVVTASATAAKSLADLANNVPNEGGVKAWFTGDNSIAAFGDRLVSFGANFAAYSQNMKSVDSNVVTTTSNAAQSLVTLANSLPEDKMFTNETHLDEFGKQLADFGKEFAKYYSHISGINPSTLSGVVTEVWRLLNLFTQMSSTSFDGASGFKTALNDLAKTGVDEFVKTFTNATTKVSTAVTSLMNSAISAANSQKTALSNAFTGIMDGALTSIRNKQPEFHTKGLESMTKFIAGVKSQDFATRNQYTTTLSSALTAIKNKFGDFESVGKTTMTKFIGGVKGNTSSLNSTFTSVLSSAVSAIRGYYSSFYDAGKYLALGFAAGIEDSAYAAEVEARAMAQAAVNAAEEALDENSPSKVMYKVGAFAGEGFVNALSDYEDKADKAGYNMAYASIKSVSQTIAKLSEIVTDSIDVNPTITPVLDLSEVEAETSRLNSLFSMNRAMTISGSMNRRAAALNNQNEVQNGTAPVSSGNSYQFVQNNYSPKSLSRVELYRQTNNQFSAFQRTVKA